MKLASRARYTPEERSRILSEAGRRSSGNFANNPDRAVEAGRIGGFAANFRTQGHAKAARARREILRKGTL